MRQLLPVFFCFCSLLSFGQNALLHNAVSWFGKSDKATIDAYLKESGYGFIGEKDSLEFHRMSYSLAKTENGTQPVIRMLLSDSSLELISIDTYGTQGQQAIVPVLKSGRFKSIGTDINGNFITTTYDNGILLIQEDYEAIENPLGKGELAYFRYRICRKYGKFDTLNGKKMNFSDDGYQVVENYKNGGLDGERITYYHNGTVKQKENYRAGRLNGLVSDYNDEGKLTHTSTHSYHWKYGMEKWYNGEGKVVKSLQWQRNVAVGTEKQTFNGQTIGSVSYVKGIKQRPAQIPVYSDPFTGANISRDTLDNPPLAIETVNYKDGLKSGTGVCKYFNQPDTLYVVHYKEGKPDSTFTRYGEDGILYTTNFTNGLENGTRIYKIPSGPLKDTVYRIENYKNGERDGLVIQYYKKERDQPLTDPDPGYFADKLSSDRPTEPTGKWFKAYQLKTYANGVLNGPYSYGSDSMIYNHGTYVNGKLHGIQEAGIVLKDQYVRIICEYDRNARTGEWIMKSFPDSIVETDQYVNNRKQGASTKTVKGFRSEERLYHQDTLQQLTFFDRNSDSDSFTITFVPDTDSAVIGHKSQKKDRVSFFSYKLITNKLPETFLELIADSLRKGNELELHLNGPFSISKPGYEQTGNYRDGKPEGGIFIKHTDAQVLETIKYTDGVIEKCQYTRLPDQKSYSGIFTAATTGEQISVKNGLRHGWCIQYDASKTEVSRTKYAKGVAKKTIAK